MTRSASGPRRIDHHVSQIDDCTRCNCRAQHPGAGTDFGLGRLARWVPWRLPWGVFSQGLGVRTLGIRRRPGLVLLPSLSMWLVLNSQGDQPRRPIISSREAGGHAPGFLLCRLQRNIAVRRTNGNTGRDHTPLRFRASPDRHVSTPRRI